MVLLESPLVTSIMYSCEVKSMETRRHRGDSLLLFRQVNVGDIAYSARKLSEAEVRNPIKNVTSLP